MLRQLTPPVEVLGGEASGSDEAPEYGPIPPDNEDKKPQTCCIVASSPAIFSKRKSSLVVLLLELPPNEVVVGTVAEAKGILSGTFPAAVILLNAVFSAID